MRSAALLFAVLALTVYGQLLGRGPIIAGVTVSALSR